LQSAASRQFSNFNRSIEVFRSGRGGCRTLKICSEMGPPNLIYASCVAVTFARGGQRRFPLLLLNWRLNEHSPLGAWPIHLPGATLAHARSMTGPLIVDLMTRDELPPFGHNRSLRNMASCPGLINIAHESNLEFLRLPFPQTWQGRPARPPLYSKIVKMPLMGAMKIHHRSSGQHRAFPHGSFFGDQSGVGRHPANLICGVTTGLSIAQIAIHSPETNPFSSRFSLLFPVTQS